MFVFAAPAYAERDKHSSLYDKLREVCDLWIMNDVMKLEEFQPERKKKDRVLDEQNMLTHEEAEEMARNHMSIMSHLTGAPPISKSLTMTFPGGIPQGGIFSGGIGCVSDNIPESETKTQIRITLSGVCGFEVDSIIDYMIRHAAKGWDAHVMAKPLEYKEDPTIVWQKINVARV